MVFCVISEKKILKYGWFGHAYCGLALDYPKEHQTHESYVRCLLCKQDVRIASRGITTFWEHCRGIIHHRLDCPVRLRRGLALRKRDGTLMAEAEADLCVANRAGETVPTVEVCPNLSVLEVLQAELDSKSVWSEKQDADEAVQTESVRLFISLVIDAMYRDCNFTSVQHLWDLMVAASNSQHSALFGSACRETDVLVIMTFVLILYVVYMLHVFQFLCDRCMEVYKFWINVHIFNVWFSLNFPILNFLAS